MATKLSIQEHVLQLEEKISSLTEELSQCQVRHKKKIVAKKNALQYCNTTNLPSHPFLIAVPCLQVNRISHCVQVNLMFAHNDNLCTSEQISAQISLLFDARPKQIQSDLLYLQYAPNTLLTLCHHCQFSVLQSVDSIVTSNVSYCWLLSVTVISQPVTLAGQCHQFVS